MHASSTLSISHECEDIKPVISSFANHQAALIHRSNPFAPATAPTSSSHLAPSRSAQNQRQIAWAKACGKAVMESRFQAATESRLHALADVSLEVCNARQREMIRRPLANANSSPASSSDMDLDEGCPPLSPAAASDDSDSDSFDSSDAELATPPDVLRQGARRGSYKPLGPSPWVRRSESETVVDHREGRTVVTRYEMIEESTEMGVRVYRRMAVTTVDGPRHRPYTIPLRREGRRTSISSDSYTAPQLARMNAPMVPLPHSLPRMANPFATPSTSMSSRRPAPRLNLRFPTSHSIPSNDHRRAASTLRVSQVASSSSRALQNALFGSPPTKTRMNVDRAGFASLGAPFEFVRKDRSLCSRRGKAVSPLRLV